MALVVPSSHSGQSLDSTVVQGDRVLEPEVSGAERTVLTPSGEAGASGGVQQQDLSADPRAQGNFSSGPANEPYQTQNLSPQQRLLSVRYNQDFSCFACATEGGFRLYSCEPLWETIRRDFDGRGVGLVEMLFKCNFLALVGGGQNPRYPPNKVMIWDDNQTRCIGELTFRSDVRAVRLRRDCIVVVLEFKVYVYNFANLKLMHQMETMSNPKGLCEISQAPNHCVLACPGKHRQQIRVELLSMQKTTWVYAHESAPACLALTMDGRRLATASVKGTVIRVFDTLKGTKLQELRRGMDKADVYSLAFSANDQHLAATSDRGTVHVFALHQAEGEEGASQPTQPPRSMSAATAVSSVAQGQLAAGASFLQSSSLSFVQGVLPKQLSYERSMALFRIPGNTQAYAAFGSQPGTLLIICTDGRFYRLNFDVKLGGEMKIDEAANFLAEDA